MPSLININVNQKGSDNNVPILRQPKFMAFLKSLLSPIIKLQGDIASNYIGGLTYSNWNSGTTYSYGDRVTLPMLSGNASYEYINATPSSGNAVTDTNYWYKLTSDNIGLAERLNYNASKMQLEYILNRRFSPSTVVPPFDAAHSSIYIVNNGGFARILWSGRGTNAGGYVAPNSATTFYYCPTNSGLSNYFSTKNFTIMVPTAILNSIGFNPPNQLDAKRMIAKETEKYNTAGITFDVQPY